MQVLNLADYTIKLANVRKDRVKFVILDGSSAIGQDRRYSDYDVMVLTKDRSRTKKPIDLFGVYGGRLVTGWLLNSDSFKSDWIGEDNQSFVWRTEQIRKAKLLYGDKKEFGRIKDLALKRTWNKKRQFAVIRYSYVTMMEYMGKMLNKMNEDDAPEFYQDAYIIAWHSAMFVAGINRINLNSDNTMYRQIFREAEIKPPNFKRDFLTTTGFSSEPRERNAVVSAAKRIVLWARKYMILNERIYGLNDKGFRQITHQIDF